MGTFVEAAEALENELAEHRAELRGLTESLDRLAVSVTDNEVAIRPLQLQGEVQHAALLDHHNRLMALEDSQTDPTRPAGQRPDPSRDGFELALIVDLTGDLDEMGVGVQTGDVRGLTLANGVLRTVIAPDHDPRGSSMRSEISLGGTGRTIRHGQAVRMVRERTFEKPAGVPFRASMTETQSHSTSSAQQHSPMTGTEFDGDVVSFVREDERGKDVLLGQLTPPVNGSWFYEEHELHLFADGRGFAAYRLQEIGGTYADAITYQGPTANVREGGNYTDPEEVQVYMKGGYYATGREDELGAGMAYDTRRVELWIRR